MSGGPSTQARQAGLITPEAVRVDLPLAEVGTRALGILVDLMVVGSVLSVTALVSSVVLVAGQADGGLPAWLGVVFFLTVQFAVLWGYPVLCETRLHGRTIGKIAMGLRVVTVEGAPVRFRHAAVRGVMALPDFYLTFGMAAVVSALVTRRGQRLGDLAAGTMVVRDRRDRSVTDQPVRWHLPPNLAPYARTLDVRGLTAADYATVRSFLLRTPTLDADTRLRLATELADALSRRMRHQRPPELHPELMVLAVAVLLQDRGARAATASPQPWQVPAPPTHPAGPPPPPRAAPQLLGPPTSRPGPGVGPFVPPS